LLRWRVVDQSRKRIARGINFSTDDLSIDDNHWKRVSSLSAQYLMDGLVLNERLRLLRQVVPLNVVALAVKPV
jgi:hypothetical protein